MDASAVPSGSSRSLVPSQLNPSHSSHFTTTAPSAAPKSISSVAIHVNTEKLLKLIQEECAPLLEEIRLLQLRVGELDAENKNLVKQLDESRRSGGNAVSGDNAAAAEGTSSGFKFQLNAWTAGYKAGKEGAAAKERGESNATTTAKELSPQRGPVARPPPPKEGPGRDFRTSRSEASEVPSSSTVPVADVEAALEVHGMKYDRTATLPVLRFSAGITNAMSTVVAEAHRRGVVPPSMDLHPPGGEDGAEGGPTQSKEGGTTVTGRASTTTVVNLPDFALLVEKIISRARTNEFGIGASLQEGSNKNWTVREWMERAVIQGQSAEKLASKRRRVSEFNGVGLQANLVATADTASAAPPFS